MGARCPTVVSAVASQQQGPGFLLTQWCTHSVGSLCSRGFPLGSPVSSHTKSHACWGNSPARVTFPPVPWTKAPASDLEWVPGRGPGAVAPEGSDADVTFGCVPVLVQRQVKILLEGVAVAQGLEPVVPQAQGCWFDRQCTS